MNKCNNVKSQNLLPVNQLGDVIGFAAQILSDHKFYQNEGHKQILIFKAFVQSKFDKRDGSTQIYCSNYLKLNFHKKWRYIKSKKMFKI